LKDSVITYSASGFEIIPSGGYVITGSRNTIRTSDQQALFTKPLVITLDANGSLVKKVIGANGLSGKAVTVNSGGNFLILSTDNDSQMVLTELKASDLTSSWFNAYGAGDGLTLARRLFLDENSKVYWGGFVQKTLSGIRFIRTAQKSQNTDFDLLYKSSPISTASDFCRFGFDFAFIGNSTADSLFVKRITRDGIVAFSKSYTFPVGSVAPVTVTPNSVNSTQDGGLVVLATVNKAGTQISDNDYALLKINAFGEPSWTQIFGSPRFQDNGVSVLQASNGGLWVLGTTTQGGIAIITLTKTDKNGKIE
ncbi:MAG: hypothetical protein K2U26_13365, partial [Cyclobacteriaceae bacterium]|nr:hypothetical protein [Cyclobacteriaceae bacterium]